MIKSLSSLFIIIMLVLITSCNFNAKLDYKEGAITFSLPETVQKNNSERYSSMNDLPSSYTITVTNLQTRETDSRTYEAGSTVIVDRLGIGKYEVVLEGETDFFYFTGKTEAVVRNSSETQASITLEKLRKPLYVNSSSSPELANGSKSHPFPSIKAALKEMKYVNNLALYMEGTFNESLVIDSSSNLKKLYIMNNPDMETKPVMNAPVSNEQTSQLPAPAVTLDNSRVQLTIDGVDFYAGGKTTEAPQGIIDIKSGSFELLNSNISADQHAESLPAGILLYPEGKLKIGGSTKLDKKLNILLHSYENKESISPIIISEPLTADFVSYIDTTLKEPLDKHVITTEEGTDIDIREQSAKFKMFDVDSDNKYFVRPDGFTGSNQTVTITVNNATENHDYNIVIKINDIELCNYNINTGNKKNMSDKLKYGDIPYYFRTGDICTVEVYNMGKFITKKEIIVKDENTNKINFYLNPYYVKAMEDDTGNDGLSEEKAFASLKNAVEHIGATDEEMTICIVGNIPDNTDVTLAQGTSPVNLIITGKDNAVIKPSTLSINNGGSVTLNKINVSGNIAIYNGTLNLSNDSVIGKENIITVTPTGTLNMEDNAKAGKIKLEDSSVVNIKTPLKSAEAGTIVKEKITSGMTLLAGELSSYDKFKLDDYMGAKNHYTLNKNGQVIENKQATLNLNRRISNTTYNYKIKETGTDVYLNDKGGMSTSNGIINDYYFIEGKTYTIDIFETDKLVGSGDITVASTGNVVTIDLYYYFVSNTGDDNNNGLSQENAFRTINKAVESIGNGYNYEIKLTGDVTDDTPVVLSYNNSSALIITAASPVTITGNNITVNSGHNITLDNIKLTGTTTINNKATITLKGAAEAGNVTLKGGTSKIVLSGTLSSPNAGTITIAAPSMDRIVLTGDVSSNYDKFTVQDSTYTIDQKGNLVYK